VVCTRRQTSGEASHVSMLFGREPTFNQILLSIAAVISLALGLFQDFGTPRPEGEPPVDWVEGVAIVIAIAIVVSADGYHISADFE